MSPTDTTEENHQVAAPSAQPTPSIPQAEPSPPLAAPVMDVVPPQPEAQEVSPEPTPAPAADDTVPPPAQTSGESSSDPQPTEPVEESPSKLIEDEAQGETAEEKPAAPVNKPKKPKNNVGAAITATVIIVLALAGMAVFAYMQSK